MLFCLAWVVPAEANPSSGKATKKPAVKTKGKAGKRNVRARTSAPRQAAPTPDRYRVIQQALADKGYEAGPVDGAWGPEWVAALKQFQADQKLDPDGKLGALSLIALGLGPNREEASNMVARPEPIE